MTNDHNLEYWEQFCSPPPDVLKKFTRSGGFSGTDINPQWRMLAMTRMFGPIGKGWGYDIVSKWTEEHGTAKYCFVELLLWYKDKSGNHCTVGPVIGGTDASRTPDESWKMSITDGMTKAMSMLGVGADVYMANSDTKHAVLYHEGQESNRNQEQVVNQRLALINTCTDAQGLDAVGKMISSDFESGTLSGQASRDKLAKAFSAKLKELNSKPAPAPAPAPAPVEQPEMFEDFPEPEPQAEPEAADSEKLKSYTSQLEAARGDIAALKKFCTELVATKDRSLLLALGTKYQEYFAEAMSNAGSPT